VFSCRVRWERVCHFVTGYVPAGVSLEQVRIATAASGRGLACTPVDHAGVRAQLPPGATWVRLQGGLCDCGTPLGAGTRPEAAPGHDVEREVAGLVKRGWSAGKIARWREQRASVTARDQRAAADRTQWLGPALDEWLRALGAALDVTPELGLYLHEYRGGLASETLDLSRRVRVPRARIDDALLRQLPEDVLHVFHR
jgi:hypothetical protein